MLSRTLQVVYICFHQVPDDHTSAAELVGKTVSDGILAVVLLHLTAALGAFQKALRDLRRQILHLHKKLGWNIVRCLL